MNKLIALSPAIIIILVIISTTEKIYAQKKSRFSSFRELGRPEKWWVVTHPFIAGKVFDISHESLKIARSLEHSDILDGDIHGGQVDAFKHAFWMAMLVQEISANKARRLGLVHEKGDYFQFKKNVKKGKDAIHDEAASAMDLFNNEAGREIGLQNKGAEPDDLKDLVINAILTGNMKIIKKDRKGNFLNKEGEIIPLTDCYNKWENPKVLVPSNYAE